MRNIEHKRIILLVCMFCIMSLFACVPDQNEINNFASTTIPADTPVPATVTPLEAVPTYTPTPISVCTSSLKRVSHMPGKKIMWWSEDSDKLFYEYMNETIWVYDLVRDEKYKLENVERPQPEKLPDSLSKYIPEWAMRVDLSPSGEKAVFTLPYGDDYVTPTPQTMGIPSGVPDFDYNLYLVQEGDTEAEWIGRINGQLSPCVWTPDENKVLIDTYVYWENAYIWMVDLQLKKIEPFIPVSPEKEGVFILDISPDGQNLLFVHDGFVWLKDLETGEEIPTSLESNFHDFWWLQEDGRMLILRLLDTANEAETSLFTYDFETGNLNRVSDLSIDSVSAILSPDQRYLAFVEDGTDDLYVMLICQDGMKP